MISFTGGRPGMISAATAAVAVLVVPLVRDHGVEYLFAASILMGIIQIAAGLLRLNPSPLPMALVTACRGEIAAPAAPADPASAPAATAPLT